MERQTMGALTYREMQIFVSGIGWRMMCLAAGVIGLLLWKAGSYGGFFGSILLAMLIGIQNLLCMRGADREKTSREIIAKYLSVAGTAVISVIGSILCNLLAYRGAPDLWILQIALWSSALIPLVWSSLCLPVFYWFGFEKAKIVGLILVIPIFYLVKFFEDGPGISALPIDLPTWMAFFNLCAIALFFLSACIGIVGCRSKLRRGEGQTGRNKERTL